MMQLIMPEYYGEFVNDRAEMHRLRYRAFKQRVDWTVEVSGDMEVDEFDVLRPVHLLNRWGAGQIQSCVRLLPSTGATMLRDAFPILLDGQPAPRSDWIWRAADSRSMFPRMRRRAVELLLPLTCCLRAFGLSIELIEIVTVTDPHGADSSPGRMAPSQSGKSAPPWKHHGCRRLPGGAVRCVGPHPQGANLGTGALGSGHSSRCLASEKQT